MSHSFRCAVCTRYVMGDGYDEFEEIVEYTDDTDLSTTCLYKHCDCNACLTGNKCIVCYEPVVDRGGTCGGCVHKQQKALLEVVPSLPNVLATYITTQFQK
jgi:hypothetical protein